MGVHYWKTQLKFYRFQNVNPKDVLVRTTSFTVKMHQTPRKYAISYAYSIMGFTLSK